MSPLEQAQKYNSCCEGMLSLSEFCDRYWLNFTEFLISFKEKYVDVGKEIFYKISMSYFDNFGS